MPLFEKSSTGIQNDLRRYTGEKRSFVSVSTTLNVLMIKKASNNEF